MDLITQEFQKLVPWTLPYADDVMHACEGKDELERSAGLVHPLFQAPRISNSV